MKRKLFTSFVLILALTLGGALKYTNILVVDTGNELTSTGVKKADAWYSSYLYRQAVVLDEALITGTSNLTNFPVLVKITDNNIKVTGAGGKVTNSNGYDIIFTDDLDNILAHEIESYDSINGVITAWVKVPTLYYNSDTTILMYYGNSGISTSQENKTGVWSNGYAGVWHLGANLNDSTSNANNGTNVGATTGVAGAIGNAISSNGASGRVTVANHASLKPSNVTISAWVYRNGAQDSWGKIAFFGQNAVNPWGPYGIQFNNTSDTQLSGQIASSTTSYPINATSSTLNDLTWAYVAETYDGSTQKLYFNNDTPYSAVINVTIADYDSTNGLGIGGRYDGNSSQAFLGSVDEVRISNVARTADWIQAEYAVALPANQGVGAGKFVQSIGPEVPIPASVVLLIPTAM